MNSFFKDRKIHLLLFWRLPDLNIAGSLSTSATGRQDGHGVPDQYRSLRYLDRCFGRPYRPWCSSKDPCKGTSVDARPTPWPLSKVVSHVQLTLCIHVPPIPIMMIQIHCIVHPNNMRTNTAIVFRSYLTNVTTTPSSRNAILGVPC